MLRLGLYVAVVLVLGCVPEDRPATGGSEAGSAQAGSRLRQGKSVGEPEVRASRPHEGRKPRSARKDAAARPGPSGSAEQLDVITAPFHDSFDRAEIGPDYHVTSKAWQIQGGSLCVRGARNHPVWLRRRLPEQARIEFEAVSRSSDGDIKVEAWGNGQSAASGTSYTDATSYLFIYGGWKNRFHVLARLDEHASDRLELAVNPSGDDVRARPVEPHHTYQMKIVRENGVIHWYVDDIEIHTFRDPKPLRGAGHEHFAFNNWEVPVCFDRLTITPL